MSRVRLAAAVALTGCLIPLSAAADDGNLTQQLRFQQNASRFQLMLEQVRESARRRGAVRQTDPAARAGASTPANLGDWTESARLHPNTVSDPVALSIAPTTLRRLRAEQAFERDQQRMLGYRQQRRALIIRARTGAPLGVDFGTKRRELVRYKVQGQQQSLQRKLRR